MFDFIHNTTSPILAALVLGLLFAFDACQILSNTAAIGFLYRNVTGNKRFFIKGLYFILGKIAMFLALSFVLIYLLKSGSKIFHLGHFFLHYWEIILIFALIIFGLLLLFSHKITWLKIMFSTENIEKHTKNSNFGGFVLGAVLSLVFCPTNAVLFFGMLIPLAASVNYGFFTIPLTFSLTTAIPAVLIMLIMVFGIKNIDKFYKITNKYSQIAIKITGILLILAGLFLFAEHFFHGD